MHLPARAACRRHLGTSTEGRRETDTTENEAQQLRAAVVQTPFPAWAIPPHIHLLMCFRASNHAPHLHPLFYDLYLSPPHTPPCTRDLYY